MSGWLWGSKGAVTPIEFTPLGTQIRPAHDPLLVKFDMYLSTIKDPSPALAQVKASAVWKTRFLMTNKDDPQKATEAVKHMLKRRKELDIDNIFKWKGCGLDEQALKTLESFPLLCFYGETKHGNPLSYTTVKNTDFNLLAKEVFRATPSELKGTKNETEYAKEWILAVHRHIQSWTQRVICPLASKKHRRPVFQTVSIIDLEGFGLSSVPPMWVWHLLSKFAELEESLFPGLMGLVICINVPTVFTMTWKMIKGLLPAETIARVKIYGGPEEWKPACASIFTELPKELGGTGRSITAHHERIEWVKAVKAQATGVEGASILTDCTAGIFKVLGPPAVEENKDTAPKVAAPVQGAQAAVAGGPA